jgi:hypothetical protein
MSIGRRVVSLAPVAAVLGAVGKKWSDDRPRRDHQRVIHDSMYSELLGAFKALIEDFREYRRTHP